MSGESQVVIAVLSLMTVTWIGVFAYLGARVASLAKSVSELKADLAAHEALRQELCESAKHNVRQIWNRLDGEQRAMVRTLIEALAAKKAA